MGRGAAAGNTALDGAAPHFLPEEQYCIATWLSLTALVICCSTSSGECPGRMRQFTFAWANSGSALFARPASKRVGVQVVLSSAFINGLAAASLAALAPPGVVFKTIDDPDATVQIVMAWLPELEDATVGRFVAFLRDQSRSRQLV